MNNHKQSHHYIDILFVITLLGTFIISSILLLIMGLHIYQNSVRSMNLNYDTRTAFAYITEKFQQLDTDNSVSIRPFGDGDAVFFHQQINNSDYQTCLYLDKGELKELLTKSDVTLSPSAGQNIFPCKALQFTRLSDDLYHITIISGEGQKLSVYISTHSGGIQS